MKKASLILFIFISILTFGQKRQVTNAWGYHKDGYLDDAKDAIDKAEANPETKDWYRTYFIKGKIYRDLGISDSKKMKKLCDPNCFNIAYDAFIKSIQLNFKDPANRQLDVTNPTDLMKFSSIIQKQDVRDFESTEDLIEIVAMHFPALSNDFVMQGADFFKDGNYESAYQSFSKAMTINFISVDTQLVYFTLLAAMNTDRYKEAANISGELIKLDFGKNNAEKVSIYQYQAMAYRHLDDTAKMLKTINKGIENYPNDSYPLVIEGYNYYVGKNNNVKALEYINIAIQKAEATNNNNNTNKDLAQLYSLKGTILQNIGKNNDAIVEFNKALEIAPDFNAYYSLGAVYNNAAADTIAWADNNIPLTDKEYAKKYKVYEDIAIQYLDQARIYLEKAYELNPKNIEVLQSLRTIYRKNRDDEKYAKMDAEIKALTTPQKPTPTE